MAILDSEYWAEFYKGGFFGFGEEGNFKYFSFWHFLPIILLIAAIILTYIFREKIKEWKHEKTFRLVLGILMMLVEMGYYWRLIYAGPGNTEQHNLLSKLPFQVCEWTCIFAMIMVFTENKHLFDIDVFVCLTLGIFPLFIPAVIKTTGPTYFRYYQFWGEHTLPIYSVFYMMFIKGYKFNWKTVYKPIIFLSVLTVFALILNSQIPDGTYLYLRGDDLGPEISKLLTDNQFIRLPIYAAIVAIIFGIEILVFYLIRKYRGKNKTIENEETKEIEKEAQ